MQFLQRSESFVLTKSFNFQKLKDDNKIKIEKNYNLFKGKRSFLAAHMFLENLEEKQNLLMYYLSTLLDYIDYNFIATSYRARSELNNNETLVCNVFQLLVHFLT